MASTKLIVLKSKEIIYTAIFVALVILLIIILSIMFKQPATDEGNNDTASSEDTATDTATDTEVFYNPGTYSSTVSLGDTTLSVLVTVDEESITDVALLNLDETITTMYPLLEPSMEDINTQLQYVSSIDNITYSGDNQYTTQLLCNAIKEALEGAVKN
jgi:uncharacterized protein with FMN-binding domain